MILDSGFSPLESSLFFCYLCFPQADYLNERTISMTQHTNHMETMPVRSLLLRMSWPMMLSMLVQALYNLVDSMFVAQLSGEGFEALALAYPIQTLMIALCAGTAVGINAMISRRLGEKRVEDAVQVALNGYAVCAVISVLFFLFGLTASGPFIRLFSSQPNVVAYGTQYVTIVTVCAFTVSFQICSERVLQASGNSLGPMISQATGAVLNIILDPLFIFGIGPFPRLEVAGAAIATVLSQFAGMLLVFFLVWRNPNLKLHFKGFRPSLTVIRDIYTIGVPAIMVQLLGTLMTLGLNKVMAFFTTNGVFILGAYFKLQSFAFMPIYGLNNGLVPVVSYNYGAKRPDRVTQAIRFALVIAVSVMAVGATLFLLVPGLLLSFFQANPAQMADGIPALRMIGPSFLFAGACIIFSAAFQSVGAPRTSLLISLLRQVALLLPAALLLGWLAPGFLWLAFPVAEILSCTLAVLCYRRVYQTKIAFSY